MKTFKLFLIALILCPAASFSQSREEYAKQREAEMRAYQQQRQQGVKAQATDFKRYQTERDKAFSDYLKKRWTEMQVYRGVPVPESPKPKTPPELDPDPQKSDGDNEYRGEPLHPAPPPLRPVIPKPAPKSPAPDPNAQRISVPFFGDYLSVESDRNFLLAFSEEVSESGIARHWDVISSAGYANTLSQLQDHAAQMRLNDWGYYMLVDAFAEQVHPNDQNSHQLLAWAILLKSGFKARIAYSGTKLTLMLPVHQQIYVNRYISSGGLSYYLMKSIGSPLMTYEKDHPEAKRVFNLQIAEAFRLPMKQEYRKLAFNFQGKEYSVEIAYNSNLVEFYKAYPSVDLDIHFNSAVSEVTEQSIQRQFAEILRGKSDIDQANLLLTFMHQAFPYKTDGEQFQQEKYFFVEDIFAFPFSDCEDRSVLYAYLMRQSVGVKTVGINGPGHVFTAVDLNLQVGDYIKYGNDNYTICDPTYMGAKVGQGMPDMMRKDLKVIPTR